MNKKILFAFVILIVLMIFVVFKINNSKQIIKVNIENKDEILDLKKEDLKTDESNRYQVLVYLTNEDPQFDRYPTYQLDPIDQSSKVMIGTYPADDFGKKGGIIFLRQLDKGKYSIYWEIKSSNFIGPLYTPEVILKDINNDGSLELITSWRSRFIVGGINSDQPNEFWILSLDLINKTYKILNPVVDKQKNEIKNFNLEKVDFNEDVSYNRFDSKETLLSDLLQDLDNDGIPEIVIKKPTLENNGVFGYTPEIMKKNRENYSQIWKWDGSKYFLWKEEIVNGK